jgi:hypothetical protein
MRRAFIFRKMQNIQFELHVQYKVVIKFAKYLLV